MFLNRIKEEIIFENEDYHEGLLEEEPVSPYPDIPAEVPGVELARYTLIQIPAIENVDEGIHVHMEATQAAENTNTFKDLYVRPETNLIQAEEGEVEQVAEEADNNESMTILPLVENEHEERGEDVDLTNNDEHKDERDEHNRNRD